MAERPSPLFQLIAEVKDSLHELVKTISAYQRTKESKEEEIANTERKVVVRLPVEVTKYYESEERERSKTNSRDKVRMGLEVAGVIAAIGLAVLTFLTLRTFNRQLSEMRKQTTTLQNQADQAAKDTQTQIELSREQANAAQNSVKAIQHQTQSTADAAVAGLRPWIKITDVQTRGNNPVVPALSFQHSETWPKDTQQVTFQIDVSYQNVGRSVARVTVKFWLFLELWKNGYDDAIRKDGKQFCDSHKSIDKNLSVIAYPSDEPLHWNGAGANLVKRENTNQFNDVRSGVGFIVPSVAVCVNYQFGDSSKTYQTRAFYEIFRKDDRTRFFEVGQSRPENDIFLIL